MAFIESPRFPEAISYGAKGGPAWSTTISAVASGDEARNQNWSAARHHYDVAHVVHADDGGRRAALIAFFHACKGRANAFRFKDYADYTVASGEGVVVELTATTFQLYKRYTSGASTYDRIIQKPIAATVALSGGGSYTLDATTGIVTVVSGADPTGWTGEFDVPCRFDIDQLTLSIESRGLYGHTDGIPLVEVRP